MGFLSNLDTPLGALVIILLLGVVLVNGWTDAPNAISTGCATRSLSFFKCTLLCGIFNLIGALASPFFANGVSENVFSLIGESGVHNTLVIVISTLLTTISFGVVAWLFGMPSSESHAMLCGLLGAGAFFSKAQLLGKIKEVVISLFVSILLAMVISLTLARVLKQKSISPWLTPVCLCALSLVHGSQDGQKFIGIFKSFVGKTDTSSTFLSNFLIALLVGVFLLLGSLLGGKRILKTYKSTSQEDSPSYFLSSDISTIISILLCSAFGMAISTGTVKLFSLVGSSIGYKRKIDKRVTLATLLVALATLPICFFLGYAFALLLNNYF